MEYLTSFLVLFLSLEAYADIFTNPFQMRALYFKDELIANTLARNKEKFPELKGQIEE